MKDFIQCLQTAYDLSPDKVMGKDFDISAWSDTWLKTSGVNTLTPIIEYNEYQTLKSFAVQ